MDTIVVMMSSYNGEKFIKEQIESILAQTGVKLRLIVRDDGSTDNTLTILNNYQNSFPEIIEIISGNNLGWRRSFFELINHAGKKYSSYQYFAFADQDDVWLSDKLKNATDSLSALSNMIGLYCSDLYYYKDGKNYGNIHNEQFIPTLKNCLVRNYATGCTIVFNRNLLLRLAGNTPEIEVAHDYWAYMVAMLCGKVIIDKNAYILYRQHTNNQIGIKKGVYNVWKRRLRSTIKSITSHEREYIAKELLKRNGEYMTNQAKESVIKIAKYRKSLTDRICLLKDNGYSLGRKSNDFWLKLRIISGFL